jgi:putative two-component system response regulator
MNSIMNGKRYKIALVDDNAANLSAGKNMLKKLYEVYPVQSGARLFELFEKVTPDLILLDIVMPGMDGYEVIYRLKQDTRYDMIPVIFLSAMNNEGSELKGLDMGAVDYVSKPFNASLLQKRINNHILISEQRKKLHYYSEHLKEEVERKTHQVIELQDTMLATVTELVEFRDGNTGSHIDRTQRYLELLVDEIQRQGIYRDVVSEWDTRLLITSAPLHDVGKIAISDAILNKPGKLTHEECEIMKKHVDFGVAAIERIENKSIDHSFLKFAKVVVGSHHEKWDGSGYPKGLAHNDIPLEGRLMAIADAYDAITSVRPYKKALSTTEAENIINKDSGTHFDPLLVNVFNKVSDKFADIAQKRSQLHIRKSYPKTPQKMNALT